MEIYSTGEFFSTDKFLQPLNRLFVISTLVWLFTAELKSYNVKHTGKKFNQQRKTLLREFFALCSGFGISAHPLLAPPHIREMPGRKIPAAAHTWKRDKHEMENIERERIWKSRREMTPPGTLGMRVSSKKSFSIFVCSHLIFMGSTFVFYIIGDGSLGRLSRGQPNRSGCRDLQCPHICTSSCTPQIASQSANSAGHWLRSFRICKLMQTALLIHSLLNESAWDLKHKIWI